MSIQQNFPSTRPSLNLNFARSQKLDPRITFTRTSSATRVNSDGLIEVVPANSPRFDFDPISGESLGLLVEEARTNLLLRSEDFSTTWTNFDSTDASNTTTSPDGTLSADTLIPDIGATNGLFRQNISGLLDNTTYTCSIFLKTAGLTDVNIQFYNKSNTFHGSQVINLSTGGLSGSGFIGTTSVVSYGNGWYRLILSNLGSGSGASTPNVRIVVLSSGDGTSGVYIWGAQLETGAFPTSYIPTAATTATRTADTATITGSNFRDFYNPNEGSIFLQALTNDPIDGSGFLTIEDGSVAEYIRMNRGFFKLEFLVSNQGGNTAQVYSIENISTGSMFKGCSAYKLNDVAITLNSRPPITDNSVQIPSPATFLRIGFAKYLRHINGVISQLTYYPTRLPNNILQNLTK